MKKIAVLTSGGVESSVLLMRYAEDYYVYPLYIQASFPYEQEELKALKTYLKALNHPNIQPIVIIRTQLDTIYEDHWSITGKKIPMTKEDASVIIPGRNTFLLTMASLWCATHSCHDIAIGIMGHPDFYDQEEVFFAKCEQALSHGMNQKIKIHVTFRNKNKKDILKENKHLPLHLTMSCLISKNGVHCGQCNKCLERRHAYIESGVKDLTSYQQTSS